MVLSKYLAANQTKRKLKIRKWDVENIPNAVVIMLIGKRGSGKSTLLMDIMYHLHDRFDVGIAVTPTVDTANDFRNCMCDSLIYESMEEADDVIPLLTQLQSIFDMEGKRMRNIYFIADDCMFNKKSFKTTNMRDILFNGRHYNITFINSAQYVMDVGTDYRSQIDYVIIIGEPTPDTREKLWDNFFKSVFTNDKDGKKQYYYTLKTLTSDRKALVLDNRTTKNESITDKIFWYKAKPTHLLPPFQLNSKVYRRMHEDTYIPISVRLNKKKQEIYAKTLMNTALAKAPSVMQVQLDKARARSRSTRAKPKPKPIFRRPRDTHDIATMVTNATPRRLTTRSTHSTRSARSMSTFRPPRCKGGVCGLPDGGLR